MAASEPTGLAELLTVGIAAVATATITRVLRRHPPGGAPRWTRTNHAGAPVSLLEGPAYAVGTALGAGAGSVVTAGAVPAVLATTGAAAAGLLDDLAGDNSSKGLKGHLGALRQGRITTGVIKIGALAVTGLISAAAADRHAGRALGPASVVGGAVIAGSANFANLLDLRPGRAAKVAVLSGIPLALMGERAAAAAVGGALGALPADLRGETMLGDTGANAAGALIGVALVGRTGLAGRAGALGVLAALTLLSERVSFTKVIESTPVLRELDAWGRP